MAVHKSLFRSLPLRKNTSGAIASMLVLCCASLTPLLGNAQTCLPGQGCDLSTLTGTTIAQITANSMFKPISTMPFAGRRGYFIVRAGETYEWSTRQADSASVAYPSELTLVQTPSTVPSCYGNDPDGPEAVISWTAPTDGAVYVGLTEEPCTANTAASVVTWRCASCPELPEVLVPMTGSNEVACGTPVRLLDPGGNGYYPNNANGYTVLQASGSTRIKLRGTGAMETEYDKLTVYAGTVPVGTPMATFTNTGFIDYTGAPGQTLTLRFSSDATTFMAGFDLQVSYLDPCEAVGIAEHTVELLNVYPNPTSGPLTVELPSHMKAMYLELIDMRGSTLRTWRPEHAQGLPLQVNFGTGLAPGCYYLKVHGQEGVRGARLFIE
ncbi:MAG: hypothetical protein JNL52_05440 [Flavobacteriales bacterium]|nr:hypothetical protein [Flavobacteriales bacterium]